MKKIIKSLSLSIVYAVLNFLIFLFIIYAIVYYKSYKKRYKPQKFNILRLDFQGTMYENPSPDLFDSDNSKLSFLKIKECIKYAAKDPTISGIKIVPTTFSAGIAQLEELGKELEKFKKTKKILVAYSHIFENKGYYLASLAENITIHPQGTFIWAGMGINRFFYKNFYDKVKIEPIEYHIGKYKSFGETFYRTHMSQESKLQLSEILFSIYNDFLEKISETRNLSISYLRDLAQNLKISLPHDSLKYKLIDNIGYEEAVDDYIKSKLKIEKKKKLNCTSINQYYEYVLSKKRNYKKNKICILIAEGQIKDGKSKQSDVIGSKDFVQLIKQIKKDKTIKAVVLRINSPGGSVIASDDIWHELMLLKKEKPIITSMSNVAASGGYYIASATDYILADKNTITGSIGVLMLLFKTQNLFEKHLGITQDVIKTEPYADIFTTYTPGLQRDLKQKEKDYFYKNIKSHYDGFIKKVSEARKMSIEDAHKRSQGRVWIGSEAKKINLIDRIGGLEEAIQMAVENADLKNKKYSVYYLPKKKMFFEMLFEDMSQKVLHKIAAFFGIKLNINKFTPPTQGAHFLLPYKVVIN